MKLADATLFMMLPATGIAASCGIPYPSSQIDGTLLYSVVVDIGTDAANVTASQYDKYFEQGSAVQGVDAVVAASQFYVNLFAVPGTEAAFQNNSECLTDGYLVNEVSWLYYDTTTASYYGGWLPVTEADTYEQAAQYVVSSMVPGLEVRFWDTNGDGYTDLIDADFKAGVTVETVTENANGTYTVYRGNIDVANKTAEEGNTFDGTLFEITGGQPIPAANFDTTITSGDVALFWYSPSGLNMARAEPITGIFIDGADHTYYNIDGVVYEDAERFSRDNLLISNRPGEFTDAQKYFQLTNDTAAGLDVTLWLVPVTNTTNTGAPIGMTGDDNSHAFLTKAVATAQALLANVTVSADGSDVPSTQEWVTQDVYTQLDDAIARANAALDSATSSSFLLDYQLYILYQELNGSSDDIGAAFAGFNYTGFVSEVQYGTA
ncbi:hypothetical protein BD289DRAFT_438131 [Coniella lustricola]|uniref:Uncharacterized protein n=1 Tax=Coniella lustricola TaxID=2025994 RepID=A0A2T3A3B4_9PEZI|nr:hypothetical protein BD289DRAFT_438131 [Coniella lustricola]